MKCSSPETNSRVGQLIISSMPFVAISHSTCVFSETEEQCLSCHILQFWSLAVCKNNSFIFIYDWEKRGTFHLAIKFGICFPMTDLFTSAPKWLAFFSPLIDTRFAQKSSRRFYLNSGYTCLRFASRVSNTKYHLNENLNIHVLPIF